MSVQKQQMKKSKKVSKHPTTIDPEVAKLTKKLIKKYHKVWKELAKL